MEGRSPITPLPRFSEKPYCRVAQDADTCLPLRTVRATFTAQFSQLSVAETL